MRNYVTSVAMIFLISFIGGQERLLCSHETLYLSIQEPTVYVQITGTYVTHNIIIAIILLMIFILIPCR